MNMEDENRIIIEDEKYEDNLKNRIDCSFDESYLHFIVSHIKKRNGRNNWVLSLTLSELSFNKYYLFLLFLLFYSFLLFVFIKIRVNEKIVFQIFFHLYFNFYLK